MMMMMIIIIIIIVIIILYSQSMLSGKWRAMFSAYKDQERSLPLT